MFPLKSMKTRAANYLAHGVHRDAGSCLADLGREDDHVRVLACPDQSTGAALAAGRLCALTGRERGEEVRDRALANAARPLDHQTLGDAIGMNPPANSFYGALMTKDRRPRLAERRQVLAYNLGFLLAGGELRLGGVRDRVLGKEGEAGGGAVVTRVGFAGGAHLLGASGTAKGGLLGIGGHDNSPGFCDAGWQDERKHGYLVDVPPRVKSATRSVRVTTLP